MIVLETLILLAIYLTPSFIALSRKHRSRWGIIVSNCLFGWTLIGWVWCLI